MAFTFDGADDSIVYSTSTDFLQVGDLSWFWQQFIPPSVKTSNLIMTMEGGTGEDEVENSVLFLDILGANNSWDIRYIHEFSTGTNEANTFLTNITNSTWVNLGLTRNITANTVKLWMDGSLIDTFNYTNDPAVGATTTVPLRIGLRGDGTFDGEHSIANIALWGSAIPDNVMLSLTKGFSPLFYPHGLILYDKLIRDSLDVIGGKVGAITGAAVMEQPSLIYPALSQVITGTAAVVSGRIMSSLARDGGLAGRGGIAGRGGGLAG